MDDFAPEHKILNTILIIGCGDIGRRVAGLCRHSGATIYALTRSHHKAQTLLSEGLHPLVGNLDQPDRLPSLPSQDVVVFYFAPPPGQGTDDPRLSAFLQRIDGALPQKLVYISTSGVYGDHRGDWVTEETPPHPSTDRARRRLAAEEQLRAWERTTGVPVAILRVGGIYGPGRLPLERLRNRVPILRESECGYTNRIHADDLAAVCLAAAERGQGIYNVSDGHPSTMTEYFNGVADRYGLPRPPQIDMSEAKARLSPEMMSYLEESRRLDNSKMLQELGVSLRYPSLAEGLVNIDN